MFRRNPVGPLRARGRGLRELASALERIAEP
jgi:hypothetical protein